MNETFLNNAQARNGNFLFFFNDDPIGACLRHYGDWAQQELDLFDTFLTETSNVIDVGANIGTHSVFFSKKCSKGSVIAIEPQIYINQILNANLLINKCFNVIPYRVACGSSNGEARMVNINPFVNGKVNYGEFKVNDKADAGFYTDIVKLDSFLKLEIVFDLLKIDVEGMEVEVLSGASKLIKKHKPKIYLEFNSHNGNDELITLLESFGYINYWHVYTKHDPNNFNKSDLNVWESVNYICNEKTIEKRYEGNIISVHKSQLQPSSLDIVRKGDNIVNFLRSKQLIP
jgi:FkbM family methyltransferase